MSQTYEYFGKYILLEKLAAGGMAEVWLARAPGAGGIGKFVAIKKILPQYSDNPEFIQMFRDEAAIALNLSHSNIVGIYEFGQEKQQLFLVLDYVEGRNLRQILNKMKPAAQNFSADQVIYMIKEVAAGLDHAHRSLNSATGKPLNITHRDMSPQNVMISFEGEVKIIDFGIAKAENQMENTKTGTLKGKFGYMSPEQAEGQATDLRTDVFSLGIVLWELLANDRLFIANNEINTLRKIRECQVPSLSKINPNIHPELERIVMKALTRDRNLRYQTAAALHRDLNRFLNRQYPDFSPHDFAVFIKTIYADEILDTRQKLIDYSKIPFPEQMGKQSFEGDKTVVTSFPQTTNTKDHRTSNSTPLVVKQKTDLMNTSPSLLTKTETFSQSGSEEISMPSAPGMAPERSVKNVLDMSALQDSFKSPVDVNIEVPHSGDRDPIRSGIANRNRRAQAPRSNQKKSSHQENTSGVMSFFVAVASVIAIYVISISFFPKQINQFQREIVKQFLPKTASTPTQVENSSELEPTGATSPQANADGATDKVPGKTPDKSPTGNRGLIVNSIPSGAEIFINGQSTGEFTPARVNIPTDHSFNLSLKKSRYVDYIKENIKAEQLDQASFTATLQKAMVAYINIDVRPSRNVKVMVNGVTLREDVLPVTGYAIPAGQSVRVQAQNLLTGEIAEQMVELYADERKTVVLRLDKGRSPSGQRQQ